MGIDLDAVTVGEGDDVATGSESAGGADVRLSDIDAAAANKIAKAVEGVLVFAASDGNLQF